MMPRRYFGLLRTIKIFLSLFLSNVWVREWAYKLPPCSFTDGFYDGKHSIESDRDYWGEKIRKQDQILSANAWWKQGQIPKCLSCLIVTQAGLFSVLIYATFKAEAPSRMANLHFFVHSAYLMSAFDPYLDSIHISLFTFRFSTIPPRCINEN